ncbi:hypothetical protein PG994_009655 [Apiospora phragmitis]|uniref:F-box domain-containing protein n=1 Tax=Apiospora phragmitis TaxID=2905665 RepID=A0ABR1U9F7_9PEZI
MSPNNHHLTREEDDLEPLEDKTEALTLRSKKTERAQKKQQLRAAKKQSKPAPRGLLLDLPYELLLEILYLLRPSDLFNLRRAGKGYDAFITSEESRISQHVVSWRYSCLAQCFRLPVLIRDMQQQQQQQQQQTRGDGAADHENGHDEHGEEDDDDIDIDIVSILQSPERQDRLGIHKRPYGHVPPPDPAKVCTCLTCVLRWSALCLVVDFAHWQADLDRGEPIPTWARSEPVPEWNRRLLARNADVVRKALSLNSPSSSTTPGGVGGLWHARLLEAHLDSTVRANRRHAANKGNKRRRFQMTSQDVAAGTDTFLERSGPPTFDFPFHRDNYYMLEAYLPNRAWIAEKGKWMYLPATQHDYDIQQVLRWAVNMSGKQGSGAVASTTDQAQVATTTR